MLYAYARVSTKKQDIRRQIANIRKAYPNIGDNHIIKEVWTGTKMARPQWLNLRSKIRTGDTIVFDSVSRMSRTADEGVKEYQELYEQGVDLVFINEPHINTEKYRKGIEEAKQNEVKFDVKVSDPMIGELLSLLEDWLNRFMLYNVQRDIQTAFDDSAKEIADLGRRTRDGMSAKGAAEKIRAYRTGKHFETEHSLKAKLRILENAAQFGGAHNDADVSRLADVSVRTLYRYKSELKEQLQSVTKEELLVELQNGIKEKQRKNSKR